MEWTTNANEALVLSLVRAGDDRTGSNAETPFHPRFTYPIYGDEETIYGYRDLCLDLRFASGSLALYLSIRYGDKLSATTVDDVEGKLIRHLPSDFIRVEDTFMKQVEEDALSFRPMGTKIASYTRRGESSKGKAKASETGLEDDDDAIVYEVYHATQDTPGFADYHRRMQLFILLYIEGGSFIQEDEDKWEFVLLLEKRRRRNGSKTPVYHFVGYSSLYPFFYWPDKIRLRLSQFVILPPFQKQGHGSQLYRAIYNYVLSQSRIAELTVEDPAEAFEDLRDKNDLEMLLENQLFMAEASGSAQFALVTKTTKDDRSQNGEGRVTKKRKVEHSVSSGGLGPPADKTWVKRWQAQLKIAGRQFQRLVEMLILRSLKPGDEKASRAYRLQVKERIFRLNFETLAQVERDERLEKLEETFQSVREDYQRILALVK